MSDMWLVDNWSPEKEDEMNVRSRSRLCFYCLGALNVITILFILAIIVLTQRRIAQAQTAADFLTELSVMPLRPEIRIVLVTGCLALICFIIYGKKSVPKEKGFVVVWFNFLEIFICFLLTYELDMAYNGLIFFVVADLLTNAMYRRYRWLLLLFACVGYIACSYELITILIPLNSFQTWITYYDRGMEAWFVGLKSVCEVCNILCFLVYIIFLQQESYRENQRILDLNSKLKDANEQLQEYAREKELMGETRERNRLAREIHDTLGHVLTGISVGTQAATVLMDTSPDLAKQQLEVIENTAKKGLDDVRRSVRKLKPDAMDTMSLDHAIYQMIDEMAAVTRTKIYYSSDVTDWNFDEEEKMTIYRIVQESTTNAVRHGEATEIWIQFTEKEQNLVISVRDNGKGCQKVTEGFGLTHLRERVELMQGQAQFIGYPGGFYVKAVLPIRRTADMEEEGKKDD